MASKETIKITVPEPEELTEFETLEDAVTYFGGKATVLEIVNRYVNSQRQAKKYRQSAAQEAKEIKRVYNEMKSKGLV